MVRHRADGGEEFALERNRLKYRKAWIERMRSAGFAEAAHEDGIGGFEKPQREVESRILLEFLVHRREIPQRLAFPDVGDHCRLSRLSVGFENQFVEFAEQAKGEIIDAEETAVFQSSKKGSLPGTAQTRNDNKWRRLHVGKGDVGSDPLSPSFSTFQASGSIHPMLPSFLLKTTFNRSVSEFRKTRKSRSESPTWTAASSTLIGFA